jgi:predicted GIY-YIG superfamily endonuclease
MWYIYILECRDGSYYTGVAKDVRARLDKHNSGKGAKYTRMKRPCTIVYVEEHPDESSARRRELEIKSWRRDKKEELIRGFPSSVPDGLPSISGQ